MRKAVITIFLCLLCSVGSAQNPEPIKIDSTWLGSIENLAPKKTRVPFTKVKKILVFSRATGYVHWTIPHNIEMLKILAKKTGAFEIHIGYDIENFEKKNLKKFDALILNNANPNRPDRDLFSDLLRQNTTYSPKEIAHRAKQYEQNLLRYVSKGGGLMILHGAITLQNNSMEVSRMTGGSFDYHPKQQKIHVKEVDLNHPMVQAFNGKGLIHIDEPYFFKNAYSDYNFRPLLYMEVNQLEGLRAKVSEKIIYVSWIKRYGKGRVFYSSPSHNAHSMNNPELLQFFLDGMQYCGGDLKCDDSPISKK